MRYRLFFAFGMRHCSYCHPAHAFCIKTIKQVTIYFTDSDTGSFARGCCVAERAAQQPLFCAEIDDSDFSPLHDLIVGVQCQNLKLMILLDDETVLAC